MADVGPASNRSDFDTVAICFADEDINLLFAELLESRGVPASIVSTPAPLRDGIRVITEFHFYNALRPDQHKNCLMVGDSDQLKHLPVLQLTRPLTEDKVETALKNLLAR